MQSKKKSNNERAEITNGKVVEKKKATPLKRTIKDKLAAREKKKINHQDEK